MSAFWCDGKQAFASRELAQSIATRNKKGREGKSMSVYRCVSCSAWHLGHRLKGTPGRKVEIRAGGRT